MGASYSAGVFFGACVERDSPLGKRLEKILDDHGGTPAPTRVQGVELGMVGSNWGGRQWVTIEAKGSARRFGRHDECPAPALLTEDPGWRVAIVSFLAKVKAPATTPVGWHFQGSVW